MNCLQTATSTTKLTLFHEINSFGTFFARRSDRDQCYLRNSHGSTIRELRADTYAHTLLCSEEWVKKSTFQANDQTKGLSEPVLALMHSATRMKGDGAPLKHIEHPIGHIEEFNGVSFEATSGGLAGEKWASQPLLALNPDHKLIAVFPNAEVATHVANFDLKYSVTTTGTGVNAVRSNANIKSGSGSGSGSRIEAKVARERVLASALDYFPEGKLVGGRNYVFAAWLVENGQLNRRKIVDLEGNVIDFVGEATWLAKCEQKDWSMFEPEPSVNWCVAENELSQKSLELRRCEHFTSSLFSMKWLLNLKESYNYFESILKSVTVNSSNDGSSENHGKVLSHRFLKVKCELFNVVQVLPSGIDGVALSVAKDNFGTGAGVPQEGMTLFISSYLLALREATTASEINILVDKLVEHIPMCWLGRDYNPGQHPGTHDLIKDDGGGSAVAAGELASLDDEDERLLSNPLFRSAQSQPRSTRLIGLLS